MYDKTREEKPFKLQCHWWSEGSELHSSHNCNYCQIHSKDIFLILFLLHSIMGKGDELRGVCVETSQGAANLSSKNLCKFAI